MFYPNKRLKLKALGINVYGGGFTLGALKHFNVVGQWEEIKLGRRAFDQNFKGIPRPLCHHKEWPVAAHVGVPFVYANPPCVPWSDINTFKGQTIAKRFLDPRLQLTHHTMEAALALQPQLFISESVENAFNYGQSFYDRFRDEWLRRGYGVTYFLTDAVLHGAACRRRRFHFIAHRHQLVFPKPPKLARAATVRDKIADLEHRPYDLSFDHYESKNGYWQRGNHARWFTKVKPGERLRDVLPDKLKRYAAFYMCRLVWDYPSRMIVRFYCMIHPNGMRIVTKREAMRILSWPDEFRQGYAPDIDIYDTVMPLMGELLAGIAKRTLLTSSALGQPEFNIIDWRELGKPWHYSKKSLAVATAKSS